MYVGSVNVHVKIGNFLKLILMYMCALLYLYCVDQLYI